MAHDPDEDRIRRKAHELWEAEGHPHGRDQDHWDQAREIIAIEDSQASTLLPRNTGAQEPIEPRQAVENYGDVPNLTDQGEHPLTDTSREPAWTSASRTTQSIGDTVGAVARPAEAPTPDIFDGDSVTPPPKPAPVTMKRSAVGTKAAPAPKSASPAAGKVDAANKKPRTPPNKTR